MRSVALLFACAAACSRTESTPPVLEASAPSASVVASVPSVSTSATVRAPRRSCEDLTKEEKEALERCAISRFGAALGYQGAFTARIEVDERGTTRIRTENDIEHKFRPALPDDACAQAGKLLAPIAPCTWDVRGPAPAWTIGVAAPAGSR